MINLKEKYKRFKEWQRRPHQVKEMSEEEHDCATCGTHFKGNYCPRCGQSAIVGRYSFKKALLLFLDVWGLGNRSMFRTVRDLLLRPGYMIRDYLKGMQMAYFPPFKMFFLLAALSVLVDTGLNIKGENRLKKATDIIQTSFDDDAEKLADEITKVIADSVKLAEKKEIPTDTAITSTQTLAKDSAILAAQKTQDAENGEDINEDTDEKEMRQGPFSAAAKSKALKAFLDWMMKHQTLLLFVWLLVLAGPLYLFFRHSPAFPDIRLSEFFVAMVYTTNMMTIISAVCGILCLDVYGTESLCYLLSVIPLMQLSGYSFWRTLWKIVCAMTILFVGIIVVSFVGALLVSMIATAIGVR